MTDWKYDIAPQPDYTRRAIGVLITVNKNTKRGGVGRVIRFRIGGDIIEKLGWMKGHGFKLKFTEDLKHCLIYPHTDGFALLHAGKSKAAHTAKVLMVRPESLPQDVKEFFMSMGDHGKFAPEHKVTDEGLELTFD
jgi:hypothetical protein